MNANELADYLESDFQIQEAVIDMLRQQQAEIEDLEKENTDLRYLIATKLEQQDGISLNSMAHPITNTPEPSYEIDPDKLETIEIDLPSPEPVAWMNPNESSIDYKFSDECAGDWNIPLYTHPVKEQLTDEEIIQINKEEGTCWDVPDRFAIQIARAILRKAQEK